MSSRRSVRCLLLLTVALALSPGSHAADPYQCQELRSIISACSCESKMVNNVPDTSKVVLACNNRDLSTVPAILGSSDHLIYEMTLAANKITNIPARAFQGLRIQRLDLRGNRLTAIDPNAFQGLEGDLEELSIGAQKSANIAPPVSSITNLTALHTLHLESFKFPQNGITTSDSFTRLTQLKSLTLKNNELTFIMPVALPTSLMSLTLDHQNFSSIPIDILQSLGQLQTLAVTHTLIASLNNEAFSANTKLQVLDLGYNKINTIYPNCFYGITKSLQTLSLRNNPINSVAVLNEVKHLKALTSLQLSAVGLTTLPPNPQFLLNKMSLVSLHLDGNMLTSLQANTFTPAGTTSPLTQLSLASNQLGTIDDEALAGLTALTTLDLSFQTSTALTLPASLTTLSSLATLKLSGTKPDSDSLWDMVSVMTTLTTLHLASTSLTTVRDYALMNLTLLTELNLDNNGLTRLTQAMLAGPRGLTKLMAVSNQITTISNCAFHGYNLSPPLSLELFGNPLTCDCKLNWLLRAIKANQIQLSGAEKCSTPQDKHNMFVHTFSPGSFTCMPDLPEDTCSELYTTPAPPVTAPTPIITITVTNTSTSSITLEWTIPNTTDIDVFKVRYMNLETSTTRHSEDIGKTQRGWEVKGLKANTAYSLCILVYNPDLISPVTCTRAVTRSGSSDAEGQGKDDDGGSSDTGVIVGVVVGTLVLLILIAAILYIAFARKRRTQKEVPPQPHTFAASELPSMGNNTKQFTRPKEKQPPKVGRALDENIKVTVISDGHTGPVSPRDRQSVGSYQFLDEKHPNPNPSIASQRSSNYSNDVEARALPSAPQDSMKGYYNHSFEKEHDSKQHAYNTIDL